MNATFKKSIALTSVIAIATVSTLIVNATNAAINGATATNVTTAVTITKATVFSDANEITFATIKNLDGTAPAGGLTVSTYGGANTVDSTSVINLSADPAVANDNKVLVISFVTATGDFGTTQLTVGTPTNNSVSVTANVVPTLSLTLANTTVALGSLDAANVVHSTVDPTATVRTNAVNGFILSVDSANNGLKSTTANHTIAAGATSNGTEGYALNVTQTANPQTNGSVVASPSLATPSTLASSTGPTAGYVATVDVAASISGVTPAAGDYSDTLTFTVTGTF
ncbi:MAG: hypothetical protein ACOYN2_03135 [Patescibacteria group bacterium]